MIPTAIYLGAKMTEKQRNRLDPIFRLINGTNVYYGDVLWHPDNRRVGWCCLAKFLPESELYVTVRSPNGAVPTVRISELRKEPPVIPKRCKCCGQLLPKEN